MLARGADVNARDLDGFTPLWWLISLNSKPANLEKIRLLAAAGADPNARGKLGRTPLIEAAELGDVKHVKVLLAVGADVRLKDESGNTALRVAALQHHQTVIRLLKQAGARE